MSLFTGATIFKGARLRSSEVSGDLHLGASWLHYALFIDRDDYNAYTRPARIEILSHRGTVGFSPLQRCRRRRKALPIQATDHKGGLAVDKHFQRFLLLDRPFQFDEFFATALL